MKLDTTFKQYLGQGDTLRYLFFGGKGGVGKTAVAGATALALAGQGRKTLLASTNPVHSLTSLLGQDVMGRPVEVTGGDGLVAYEIDTKETIERSKTEIREKINWFLKFADITTKADDFVESATMNPAFEESAMFENMVDLIFKDEYETYVFDTAPTANARRLLGMSRVYSLWVDKMLKSREEAKSLRELLSFSKNGARQRPPDRSRTDGFLLRNAPGGFADRRRQEVHALVRGVRHTRRRGRREHVDRGIS
jgi:arsenite-transporting ATPase